MVGCWAVSYIIVRIEVFPERDGNWPTAETAEAASCLVRIEVFPERDGNFRHFGSLALPYTLAVRIEVFPERDGNYIFNLFFRSKHVVTSE